MTPVAYCCTERVKNHAHTRPRTQDVCIKSLLISSRPVSFLPAAPKLSRTCVLAVIDMLNFLLPEARTRATFLKLPAAEGLCCGSFVPSTTVSVLKLENIGLVQREHECM